MKKFLFLVIFGLATAVSRAELRLEANDFVAICGDSITAHCIYSVFMEDYFLMCQPAPGLRALQEGWSGETAPLLLARLGLDLFPFKPTVVTTCYGMNDGHYAALTPVVADAYRAAQTELIQTLKKNGVRVIVVGSPGCVDSFSYGGGNPALAPIYNKTLTELGNIAREVAGKEEVLFADVNGPMNEVMAKAKAKLGQNYILAGGDGIHPGLNGHLVMAYAFLKALGCDGAIGTITVDLAAGTAQGTPGQKIITVDKGVVDVESSRYPFCFVPATAEISDFFPFNDELNRYLLVVHGLKTPKARVTWGTESREFSAAELEHGVNLASAFPTNPFSAPFAKVHAAVLAQQTSEGFLVIYFLHNMPKFKEWVPAEPQALDRLAEKAAAHDREVFQSVAVQVVPVRHTIKIESVP